MRSPFLVALLGDSRAGFNFGVVAIGGVGGGGSLGLVSLPNQELLLGAVNGKPGGRGRPPKRLELAPGRPGGVAELTRPG